VSAGQNQQTYRSHLVPVADRLALLPYWLLIAILLAVILFWNIANNESYRVIFNAVSHINPMKPL